jgi:hypothetical protein
MSPSSGTASDTTKHSVRLAIFSAVRRIPPTIKPRTWRVAAAVAAHERERKGAVRAEVRAEDWDELSSAAREEDRIGAEDAERAASADTVEEQELIAELEAEPDRGPIFLGIETLPALEPRDRPGATASRARDFFLKKAHVLRPAILEELERVEPKLARQLRLSDLARAVDKLKLTELPEFRDVLLAAALKEKPPQLLVNWAVTSGFPEEFAWIGLATLAHWQRDPDARQRREWAPTPLAFYSIDARPLRAGGRTIDPGLDGDVEAAFKEYKRLGGKLRRDGFRKRWHKKVARALGDGFVRRRDLRALELHAEQTVRRRILGEQWEEIAPPGQGTAQTKAAVDAFAALIGLPLLPRSKSGRPKRSKVTRRD